MGGWIISHDGNWAWQWENPANRVRLEKTDVDDFIKTHVILSDDRKKHGGNVWD